MSDNSSSIPFHLGGPRVMESDRLFSIYVSRALNCVGKSQDMVKSRIESYTQEERYNNFIIFQNSINRSLTSSIIAGSKGEGLTAPFESDLDIMSVDNLVICADNTTPLRSLTAQYTVFKTDRLNNSPGYTKLRLDQSRVRIINPLFDISLLNDGFGNIFLSSDGFIEQFKKYCTISYPRTRLDRSGPSDPSVSEGSFQDLVIAYRCFIPDIIQSFIARHRYYGWPTTDQLNEISNLEGHVVPVGYKGSQTAFLEWRICYTKTERFLMRSLNDAQTKIYILLKMVAKTYINLSCKEITSYVLKNIVLWQAECNSIDIFKEDLLVDSLLQALLFLRNCVINNSLPSYMIPERNLLSEKLDSGQRQKLVILLTELIHKGGGLLMGCERLRGTMFVLYKTPAVAEQYRRTRNKIEKLYIWQNNMKTKKATSGATDEQINRLFFTDEAYLISWQTLEDLILPDRMALVLQRHDVMSQTIIFYERLKQWLS